MISRNSRGEITRTHRNMNTQIRAELLVGAGWEAVAQIEIKRLYLEIGAYHQQLEGKAGYEETGKAVLALKAAVEALEIEYAQEDSD